MKDWSKSPSSAGTSDTSSGQRLAADLQTAHLELEERGQIIEQLRAEVERLREVGKHQAQSAWEAHMEGMFTELAGPVSQLVTQLHLSKQPGVTLSASDVLAVSQRLVRILSTAGMETEEVIGQTVRFDPARHLPLSTQITLQPGDRVIVRSAGVKYQGKTIRKAGVEKGV